jgi:hypothetical protein
MTAWRSTVISSQRKQASPRAVLAVFMVHCDGQTLRFERILAIGCDVSFPLCNILMSLEKGIRSLTCA